MPGPAIGIKYGLHEFVDFGNAVKAGNVRIFEEVEAFVSVVI